MLFRLIIFPFVVHCVSYISPTFSVSRSPSPTQSPPGTRSAPAPLPWPPPRTKWSGRPPQGRSPGQGRGGSSRGSRKDNRLFLVKIYLNQHFFPHILFSSCRLRLACPVCPREAPRWDRSILLRLLRSRRDSPQTGSSRRLGS